MAIHTDGRVVRRQITLPPDVDARLRHLARQRGQSRSAVIAEAIRSLARPADQMAEMSAFAGAITGGGPEPLARMVDEVVYGGDTTPGR